MFESTRHFQTFQRSRCPRLIDEPMVIVFGLTIGDLILAVVSLLTPAFLIESALSLPLGIVLAALSICLSKTWRRHCPKHFLVHLGFVLGLRAAPHVRCVTRGTRPAVFRA